MKKKLVLLLALIVSLFIFSGRVDAIVMWMQCTDNAEGELNGNDEFKKYNTVAVINEYESNLYTKRVFYVGGSENGLTQKNFFEVEGPTFIANRDGNSGNNFNQKICWYRDKDSSSFVTECKANEGNPFLEQSKFNEKLCPQSVYQNTGTRGAIQGDFVALDGNKSVNDENVEILDGYSLALYQVNVKKTHRMWVMEAYNANGVYGTLFGVTLADAQKWHTDSEEYDDTRSEVAYDPLNDKDLLIPKQFFGIRGDNSDSNELFSNDDVNYDFSYGDKYIDWLQHAQLIRLYYLGRNYYKFDEWEKYPQVFLSNIGGKKDSPVIRHIDGTVHTYKPNFSSSWSEISGWLNSSRSSLSGLGEYLNKFSSNGEYSKLIEEAQNVNDSISAGKKYDLISGNYDFDSTIEKLSNAKLDLEKALNNSGFPKYREVTDQDKVSVTNADKFINNCVIDGTVNDVVYSAANYASCSIFGHTTKYAFENFAGINSIVVQNVFLQAVNDQLKNETSINNDLINYKENIKDYITIFARFSAYITRNYGDVLTEEQKVQFNKILDDYLKLARDKFEIEIVIDCGTLLGDDFIEKIGKYLNIIKIAVPLILIGFGIMDFTKAVFAGDSDEMKKAQKKFLLRIVIAILFFLLPFLIKILLSIANKAWSFISPSSCNLK